MGHETAPFVSNLEFYSTYSVKKICFAILLSELMLTIVSEPKLCLFLKPGQNMSCNSNEMTQLQDRSMLILVQSGKSQSFSHFRSTVDDFCGNDKPKAKKEDNEQEVHALESTYLSLKLQHQQCFKPSCLHSEHVPLESKTGAACFKSIISKPVRCLPLVADS